MIPYMFNNLTQSKDNVELLPRTIRTSLSHLIGIILAAGLKISKLNKSRNLEELAMYKHSHKTKSLDIRIHSIILELTID